MTDPEYIQLLIEEAHEREVCKWIPKQESCNWCYHSASLHNIVIYEDEPGVAVWYQCNHSTCRNKGNTFGFHYKGKYYVDSCECLEETDYDIETEGV